MAKKLKHHPLGVERAGKYAAQGEPECFVKDSTILVLYPTKTAKPSKISYKIKKIYDGKIFLKQIQNIY